jgi:hypothetical protein
MTVVVACEAAGAYRPAVPLRTPASQLLPHGRGPYDPFIGAADLSQLDATFERPPSPSTWFRSGPPLPGCR